MTLADQRRAMIRRAAQMPKAPMRALFPAALSVAACRAFPEYYAPDNHVGLARRAEAWRTLLDARAARTAALAEKRA